MNYPFLIITKPPSRSFYVIIKVAHKASSSDERGKRRTCKSSRSFVSCKHGWKLKIRIYDDYSDMMGWAVRAQTSCRTLRYSQSLSLHTQTHHIFHLFPFWRFHSHSTTSWKFTFLFFLRVSQVCTKVEDLFSIIQFSFTPSFPFSLHLTLSLDSTTLYLRWLCRKRSTAHNIESGRSTL